jgi:hypothetical protein
MQIGAGKGATVYYMNPFPNFVFSTSFQLYENQFGKIKKTAH